MFKKIKLLRNLYGNMGANYISYRLKHALKNKLGYYKYRFPSTIDKPEFPSIEEWRRMKIPFFIDSKESMTLVKDLSNELRLRFCDYMNHTYTFFNSKKITVDPDSRWHVNPNTGYHYDIKKHWSEIKDLSVEAGDIKYVWEIARFSYLYDIIRYDYHSETDQFHRIFNDILDFIEKNPINLGPQYICSQEISLRILNWSYALNYYKNHPDLTNSIFQTILGSIYEQLHHVRGHINFSRIAVRNNHAITETLMLYLSGLLFPFIKKTADWSRVGKKWFEQEIDYQIYHDGTFLQHSMNYHRVVIQLLTWGIRLANLNKERFSDVVYDRALKSLNFLDICKDKLTGRLPNYGPNDGALFFKFTDDDYSIYTSQLEDLRAVLKNRVTKTSESYQWYGILDPKLISICTNGTFNFQQGGYYINNRENDYKIFLRCAKYKDRPCQADNMHLDIWKGGVNYLWDCGSYQYNTDKEYLNHFQGSAGHNTFTIDGQDHILKGGRFIWYYWIKNAAGKVYDISPNTIFETFQKAYNYKKSVQMSRRVSVKSFNQECEIIDTINHLPGNNMCQHWQLNPAFESRIELQAIDENGSIIKPQREEKWYSSYYGVKEPSIKITFAAKTLKIKTIIKLT